MPDETTEPVTGIKPTTVPVRWGIGGPVIGEAMVWGDGTIQSATEPVIDLTARLKASLPLRMSADQLDAALAAAREEGRREVEERYAELVKAARALLRAVEDQPEPTHDVMDWYSALKAALPTEEDSERAATKEEGKW